jgi:LPXTG-motif cell wall-anchored protein
MFNSLFYWLGSKGCAAVGIVSELISAQSACDHQQTWNMGAVLFGAGLLSAGYFILRRRR